MYRNQGVLTIKIDLKCTKFKCNVKRIDTYQCQSNYDVGNTDYTKQSNSFSQLNGVLQSKLNHSQLT